MTVPAVTKRELKLPIKVRRKENEEAVVAKVVMAMLELPILNLLVTTKKPVTMC